MACIKTFDNNGTTGIFTGSTWSTNGTVELLGYSTVEAGPFGVGGNWPWATNTWGASVDTSPITEGFYQFKYRSNLDPGDPCYGEITFILAIVQGTTDAPASPIDISLCEADPVRNIYNDSGLFAASAVNPVVQAIGGSGTVAPGYNAGGASITDDTYDPSQETTFPTVREFDITYTPTPPAGYTLDGCANCQPVTITVRYTVTEQFETGTVGSIAVCNDGDV